MATSALTHRVLPRAVAALAALAFLAVTAPAASAHVTVSPSEAPAGGYGTIRFTVPHGCGTEPTSVLMVQLPDTLQSVTAEAVPGWEVTYTREELDEPYENHGATITEYVSVVRWEAVADPLPSDQYLTFGLSARWPDAAGDEILLPAIQECPDGSEVAWIDTDPSSETPAPRVTLVASGGHGHGSDEETATDEQAAMTDEPATTEESASAAGASENSGTDALAVAALVLSVVAVGLGAYAAVASRRGS